MTRLASHGNQVLFIENTGIRPPGFQDMPRMLHRLHKWRHSTFGIREERPNLFVYSPLVLPFPFSRIACWVNRLLMVTTLERWARAIRFHDPIVWTFLPTRLSLTLIKALRPKLVVYYCIANFEVLNPGGGKVRRWETALLREADLVFAQGEVLRQRCARYNAHVSVFPFGVNGELFLADQDPPQDLKRIPRPVIGYVGGLHRHVNIQLVADVARRRPDWSFVLIGPRQEELGPLEQLANVHLIGAKPHLEIPAYIRQFDVGVIPYALNPYTQTVYPTKLNEYLILSKPVVATRLPEIEAFNAQWGNPVAVADDGPGFVRAIEGILTDGGVSHVVDRVSIARQRDWTVTLDAMCGQIEEAILRRPTGKMTSWRHEVISWYVRVREQVLVAFLSVLLAYSLIFHTPLLWVLASPLKVSQPPQHADCIVVFAGGMGESGRLGESYQERVQQAVELYRQGYAKRLVFSSGWTYAFSEPEVMKALAVSLGVPPEVIVLETQGAGTCDSALRVGALFSQQGWRSALLVSSPYHMRRAILSMRKALPDVAVTATPIPLSLFYTHGVGANWAQIRAILHEYLALAYYRLRGWI